MISWEVTCFIFGNNAAFADPKSQSFPHSLGFAQTKDSWRTVLDLQVLLIVLKFLQGIFQILAAASFTMARIELRLVFHFTGETLKRFVGISIRGKTAKSENCHTGCRKPMIWLRTHPLEDSLCHSWHALWLLITLLDRKDWSKRFTVQLLVPVMVVTL